MGAPSSLPILIVDSHEGSRGAISRCLARHGWQVLESCSGADALDRARLGAGVTVVGVDLPDMTADEFRRRLKQDPLTRALPVLQMGRSARDPDAVVPRDEQSADAWLEEPATAQELVGLVRLLLRLREVEELTSSLRDSIGQMEEFSYTVSHDLRAPLRSINGYAGVLLQEFSHRLKGDGARYLERIIENAHRMERLVNDVLTISRMASLKLSLRRVELRPMLESLVREYPNLQPSVARVHIGELPPVIGHDSLCIQVFSNLLGNAAKFVPAGVKPDIRVSAQRMDDLVRISVRDNGIGVSPEYHDRIFGMFERLDPENRYSGTGIGLAIVRRAVEKMNGRAGVDSDGRNGSCFWVELPAATPAHESP